MKDLMIDLVEPFTSIEACAILCLSAEEYMHAIKSCTLQYTGSIRVVLPCRFPHHTYWDLFRYSILSELSSRHRSAPKVLRAVNDYLDCLAEAVDEYGLDDAVVRACLDVLDSPKTLTSSLKPEDWTAQIFGSVVSKAICRAFPKLALSLRRQFGHEALTVVPRVKPARMEAFAF